jgi:hypothetical protein
MWYFILALLFGNPSNTDINDQKTVASAQEVDNEGNTGPVRPGK